MPSIGGSAGGSPSGGDLGGFGGVGPGDQGDEGPGGSSVGSGIGFGVDGGAGGYEPYFGLSVDMTDVGQGLTADAPDSSKVGKYVATALFGLLGLVLSGGNIGVAALTASIAAKTGLSENVSKSIAEGMVSGEIGTGNIGEVAGSLTSNDFDGGPEEIMARAGNTSVWQQTPAAQQAYALADAFTQKQSGNELKIDTTDASDVFLSDKEVSYLDKIEANRVTMLTDAINEKVFEVQQTQIADLVDRGVLQGDVGATSLAKTRDYASEAIEQGTLSIGTQRMQDELNYLNSKRDFSLKQNYLDWDMKKFTEGLQWQTQQSELDRSMRYNIDQSIQDASQDASKWNAFGNIAGGVVESDWFSDAISDLF